MATKLSNVIGAPFSDYVLKQLYLRAEKNSTVTRSNDEVLFLANKSAWARLVSSVDISNDLFGLVYKSLGVSYSKPEDLAKNWVLEAGTSMQTGNGITLRQGLGPDGAYGLGGTSELGYRPMPGLTSVQIETTGRLGSLRQATVSFKVWNMDQLNVIEALYFRLGYSMLLEWGHTQYYENKNSTFKSNGIYGIGDPFRGLRKEEVQQAIAKKAKETSGNYDGMLGIVSNFTWSFNQEGGYDCTVRLVGLGAVMDSMRINQAYKLPDGLVAEYKKNKQLLLDEIKRLEKERDDANKRAQDVNNATTISKPAVPPKNINQLYEYAHDPNVDNYLGTFGQFTSSFQYYPAQSADPYSATRVPDYYYQSTAQGSIDRAKYNTDYFGLFLQGNGAYWHRLAIGNTFTLNNVLVDASAKYMVDYFRTPKVDPYYNTPINLQTKATYSWLGKYFYVESGTEITNTGVLKPIDLNQPYNAGSFNFGYDHQVGPVGSTKSKRFSTDISFTNKQADNYSLTRQQVVDGLDAWYNSPNAQLTFVSATTGGSGLTQEVIIKATANVDILNVPSTGLNKTLPKVATVTVPFTFTFNNTSYIDQVGPKNPTNAAAPQQAQTGANGDNGGAINQSTAGQTDAAEGFASALDAMLTVVQAKGQREALVATTLKPINLTEDTKLFYKDGSLNGVLTTPNKASVNPNGVPFDLVSYAQKGFNSNLFVDPTLYDSIPNVDFTGSLCYAYTVKYAQSSVDGATDKVHSPVYIQLGYLLAFLNNMCLIYDSTQQAVDQAKTDGSQKRPYVYIDFNPETNFCLTSPQQFSIDPLICLVPLNSTDDQFNSIFPSTVNLKEFKPSVFSPTKTNSVSQLLNKNNLNFKHDGNPFQGRTMNILLNTQYLLDIVKSYAGADAAHAVNLQTFLERIMVDVNKAMGNINSFRVAYRDDTNTIQIQDDQWVPSYTGKDGTEPSMMGRSNYITTLQTNKQVSGLLPIFNTTGNTLSIARQFQLKTTLSTKLASMIAISAQAATGSVNATDHSQLSYLNQHYKDRYKPWIQDPSNGGTGTNTNTTNTAKETSNDQKLAQLFSDHVSGIYANELNFSVDKIESAKNYYIERMSKVKSGDPITTAAPFIPADLEITLDGISGIIMGNAFTIPENRLPLSLRGNDGFTKVGFIVTGLSHTVDNNEWLTRIKGQMIKLRTSLDYGAVQQITSTQIVPQTIASNSSGLTGAIVDDAVNFIKSQEGLYSAQASRYVAITNPSPDTKVYAYTSGGDIPTIGWGTIKYTTGVNANKDVALGDVITATQADAEIRAEVASVYSFITSNLKTSQQLTNGQLVALISLGYNAGIGNLKDSTIWSGIQSGVSAEIIAADIAKFATTIKNTGKVSKGLQNRRLLESRKYLS